jgi:hypothetical protein
MSFEMLKVQAVDAVEALLNVKLTMMLKVNAVDAVEALLNMQLVMISEASGLEMSYLIDCLKLSHSKNLHEFKQVEQQVPLKDSKEVKKRAPRKKAEPKSDEEPKATEEPKEVKKRAPRKKAEPKSDEEPKATEEPKEVKKRAPRKKAETNPDEEPKTTEEPKLKEGSEGNVVPPKKRAPRKKAEPKASEQQVPLVVKIEVNQENPNLRFVTINGMEYIVTNENLAYLNKKLVAKFDESSKQMVAIMPSEIEEECYKEELSDDENSSDDELPIND